MKLGLPHRVAVIMLGVGLLQGCTSTGVVKNEQSTVALSSYTTDLYVIPPAEDPQAIVPIVVREFERLGFKVALMSKDRPGPGAQGTGFVISPAGHVITSAHVIGEAQAATLQIAGARYAADVMHADKDRDLALLKIRSGNAPAFAALSFRRQRQLHIGEDVATIGFPLSSVLGNSARYTKGTVSSTTGIKDDPRQIQFSAQIQPGSSGGPLFDSDGRVVGVVSTTLNALRTLANTGGALPQNVNFAIKSDVVLEFLSAADKSLHDALGYDGNSSVETVQKAVVKIRAGIVTEEWEKRPKLVARLDYATIWDIWRKFRLFVIRFFDYDSHDFLFAAGMKRFNPLNTMDKVIEETFVEIKGTLREESKP
jgi:S1-C subfamily serine protease